MRGKKAQLTIFLILGLVILMFLAWLFFLRTPVEEAELEEATIDVPVEIKPIHEFVQSCLSEKSKEALILIGQHGGYIDMEDKDLSKKTFNLDSSDPSESDAAFFTLDKSSHVAYWWFMKSKNSCFNCIFSDENAPSLTEMEKQIDKYIEQNLDSCLEGFKGFESQGFQITPSGKMTPKTTIAEDNVFVRLFYPVSVEKEGRSTNMTDYIIKHELKLKDIYNFSQELVSAEVENMFLEEIIKHVIALSSGISFSKMPPIYGAEASYVQVSWSKSLVELELQSSLTSHFPLLQVNNTRGVKMINFSNDPVIQNIYKPFFVDVLKNKYPEYSVRFFYLNWPIHLDIRPSSGDTIKATQSLEIPNSIGIAVLPFAFKPFNYYEYFYDVSVPVIAEIKSFDEFFNETYTFFIAFEVNIRDNLNPKEWHEGNGTIGPWDYSAVSAKGNSGVKEALEMEEGANPEEIKTMSIITGNFTKSLFCNDKQRISGMVNISVMDKQNETGINRADVKYSCGSYDTCVIGRTSLDKDSGKGIMGSKFPVCVGGGILEIEKPGYLPMKIFDLTTLPGTNLSINVELEPIRKKNFTVKKYIIDRIVTNDSLAKEVKFLWWNSTLHDLGPYDMLMINFDRIKENETEVDWHKFLLWYGNDSLNDENFRQIELVPGKYTVNIQYYYTNKTVIPANCSHMCDECATDSCEKACRLDPGNYTDYCSEYSILSAWLTSGIYSCATCGECDVDEWMPDKPIDLDNLILGGFSINNTTPWEVFSEDLDDPAKAVEFRFVQVPPPRCIEDLQEPTNASLFYESHRRYLMPAFG